MKAFLFSLCLWAGIVGVQAGLAEDVALARQILGIWQAVPDDKSPYVTTFEFGPEGEGGEVFSMPPNRDFVPIRATFRWAVRDGVLSIESLSSSDPKQLPVGTKRQARILSIVEDRLVYESLDDQGNSDGKQLVLVRTGM